MIYRLKELQGDTIAVPQLVFSKLGIAEEYNVRVALYVLATGVTDPEKICADLSAQRARSHSGPVPACWNAMRKTQPRVRNPVPRLP